MKWKRRGKRKEKSRGSRRWRRWFSWAKSDAGSADTDTDTDTDTEHGEQPFMHRCVAEEFQADGDQCSDCSECASAHADECGSTSCGGEGNLPGETDQHYGPTWTPPTVELVEDEQQQRDPDSDPKPKSRRRSSDKIGLSHLLDQGMQQFMEQMKMNSPGGGETAYAQPSSGPKVTIPGFHFERDPKLVCELFDDGDVFVVLADLTQFMPCDPTIGMKRRKCKVEVRRDGKQFVDEVPLPGKIKTGSYRIKNDILEITLKKA